MAHARLSTPAERARSAVLSASVVGAVGYALLNGLAPGAIAPVEDALKVFGVAPPPPPPPQEKPPASRRAAPKKEGRASPPNLKAKPVEVVQPPPIVPLPAPPPVVTAPKAGPGPDPSAGAAAIRGPGFGSGGIGNGSGSGGAGNGEGGGGGREAELISGDLRYSQLSHRAKDQLRDRTVTVHADFVVGVNGRLTSCRVAVPTGLPALDADTCRLLMAHLRYRPELDASGRPVPVTVRGEQTWYLLNREGGARPGDEIDPPEPADDRE